MELTLNTASILSLMSLAGAAGGMLFAAFRLYARLQKAEEDTRKNAGDVRMILETQFAILDGLKQLSCNGEVSKAHERLRKHVIDSQRPRS